MSRLVVVRAGVMRAGYYLFCFGIFAYCLAPAAIIGLVRSFTRTGIKPKGVFLGVHGMLGLVSRMQEILESNGIRVMSLTIYPGRFFDEDLRTVATVLSQKFAAAALLPRVLVSTDMVWFISHYSLLPMRADYALFWLSRCKLVVQHTGSDVRVEPLQNSLNQRVGVLKRYPEAEFQWRDFGQKLLRQRAAEFFGEVVCLRNASTLQGKPMCRGFFPVDGLEAPKEPSPKPLIVHAPSNRERKNTGEVIQAVEKVRESGLNVEFVCLEDTPNATIMNYLTIADIVIDARDTWVGVLGVESLARSCVVIGGADSEFESMPATPVIPFPDSIDEMAATLIGLIDDSEERGKIMEESWNFWTKFYSREAFSDYFFRVWNNTERKIGPHPMRKLKLSRVNSSRNPAKRYQVALKPVEADPPLPLDIRV